MNYSDYRFTLDVQIHQAQVSVPVTLNDTARKLYVGFTDGRKPYTIPNGCLAVFAALKPDGNTILNNCIIENNKTVVYEFSKNTTNMEGIVNCEIRLYDIEGKELTSPQFIIVVDKKVVRDEEIPLSESESSTLDDIIRYELARRKAEEERKKLAQFLATSGGVIVSEEEPQEALGNVWINSSDNEEEIFLLDSTDIAQELTDEDDKVPSVALLKESLDELSKKFTYPIRQQKILYGQSLVFNIETSKEYEAIDEQEELNITNACLYVSYLDPSSGDSYSVDVFQSLSNYYKPPSVFKFKVIGFDDNGTGGKCVVFECGGMKYAHNIYLRDYSKSPQLKGIRLEWDGELYLCDPVTSLEAKFENKISAVEVILNTKISAVEVYEIIQEELGVIENGTY